MTADDDLVLVIGLAVLTEDREPGEQRALMRTAHRLDRKRNLDTTTNTPPEKPSCLYLDVLASYHPDPANGRPARPLGADAERYYQERGVL